ncbi:MAG TPA: AraC family transcriptional regulator [Phnomibacter sp.]|nr:AraC family transcriptional regulator [Phnomibacter sp.]
MKVIPFTIPVPAQSSMHVQQEVLPAFYPHLHRHREMQITSIIKGSGTLLCGNSLLHFEPRQVFVFGPQQPHVFKSDNVGRKKSKTAVASSTVFFDPEGPLQAVLALPEMAGIQKWMNKCSAGLVYTNHAAVSISRSIEKLMTAKHANRIALLIELLQQLAQAKPAQQLGSASHSISDTAGQRIDTVVQYTLQHYAEPIAIATVAKLIHMTPPAFCRYFKQHTRKTYLQFLTELRIQEACKRLQNTHTDSIGEVAWETGFVHISNFNRVFKKIMRVSPGAYAAQFRQF